MEETDLLQQIKRKLEALQARIEARADPKLIAEVASTIRLADAHLPSVFMQARRVLEIIVRDIYRRELPDADPKPLFNMIEALEAQKDLIPRKIANDFHYIRVNGNLIIHPQDEPVTIDVADAEGVLIVFLAPVEWYLVDYLGASGAAQADGAAGLNHGSNNTGIVDGEVYDCFLSHNSKDKPTVRALADQLRARDITVWLDEEQLRPGVPWQPLLEAGIRVSRSAAVLVGKDGLGPWELPEMRAALSLAVKDGRPVIPVLLPDAPAFPDLPLFLAERTWVDLRPGGNAVDEAGLDLLVWGITGSRPASGQAHRWHTAERLAPIPPNPYRGLSAFRDQDADNYFGREPDIDDVVALVERQPLIAVVGPSGSGKSSLVFAGVLPALRRQVAERGADPWLAASFRPLGRPFEQLAEALIEHWSLSDTVRITERRKLAAALAAGDVTLMDAVGETLRKKKCDATPPRGLLLIVDQFEEIYTLSSANPGAHAGATDVTDFANLLVKAVEDTAARRSSGIIDNDLPDLRVLLTLRVDFLDRALTQPAFGVVLGQSGPKVLGPVEQQARLRAIIEKPAHRAGVALDDLLPERILRDLAQLPAQPEHVGGASLPLLEFTLKQLWEYEEELWERDQPRRLTHVGYEALGGIQQSLSKHAEGVYKALDAAQRTDLRRVLLRMIRPGDRTRDTRQIVTRHQLPAEDWQLVLRLSGPDIRFVVISADPTTRDETAEIIHEALISNWQRLQDWLAEDRANWTLLSTIQREAQAWHRDGEHDIDLPRWGERMVQVEALHREPRFTPTAIEMRFVQAARRLHEQEQIAAARMPFAQYQFYRDKSPRKAIAYLVRALRMAPGNLEYRAFLYQELQNQSFSLPESQRLEFDEKIEHSCFSPEGDRLLLGSKSLIRVYDASNWSVLHSNSSTTDEVAAAALLAQGSGVVLLHNSGLLRRYSVGAEGAPTQTQTAICSNPDGNTSPTLKFGSAGTEYFLLLDATRCEIRRVHDLSLAWEVSDSDLSIRFAEIADASAFYLGFGPRDSGERTEVRKYAWGGDLLWRSTPPRRFSRFDRKFRFLAEEVSARVTAIYLSDGTAYGPQLTDTAPIGFSPDGKTIALHGKFDTRIYNYHEHRDIVFPIPRKTGPGWFGCVFSPNGDSALLAGDRSAQVWSVLPTTSLPDIAYLPSEIQSDFSVIWGSEDGSQALIGTTNRDELFFADFSKHPARDPATLQYLEIFVPVQIGAPAIIASASASGDLLAISSTDCLYLLQKEAQRFTPIAQWQIEYDWHPIALHFAATEEALFLVVSDVDFGRATQGKAEDCESYCQTRKFQVRIQEFSVPGLTQLNNAELACGLVAEVAFSADGRRLAMTFAPPDMAAHIFARPSKSIVVESLTGAFLYSGDDAAVALSRSGRHLAVAGHHLVRVIDLDHSSAVVSEHPASQGVWSKIRIYEDQELVVWKRFMASPNRGLGYNDALHVESFKGSRKMSSSVTSREHYGSTPSFLSCWRTKERYGAFGLTRSGQLLFNFTDQIIEMWGTDSTMSLFDPLHFARPLAWAGISSDLTRLYGIVPPFAIGNTLLPRVEEADLYTVLDFAEDVCGCKVDEFGSLSYHEILSRRELRERYSDGGNNSKLIGWFLATVNERALSLHGALPLRAGERDQMATALRQLCYRPEYSENPMHKFEQEDFSERMASHESLLQCYAQMGAEQDHRATLAQKVVEEYSEGARIADEGCHDDAIASFDRALGIAGEADIEFFWGVTYSKVRRAAALLEKGEVQRARRILFALARNQAARDVDSAETAAIVFYWLAACEVKCERWVEARLWIERVLWYSNNFSGKKREFSKNIAQRASELLAKVENRSVSDQPR
jgi:hypothetical protein